jgi:hypothetical protein
MAKLKFFLLFFVFVPLLNLNAQSVDIVWQGETYIPPFYEGLSIWSYQSQITLMAIPYGSGFENPANLIYRWKKNGTVLGSLSGLGKNFLSFADTVLSKPQFVEVDIRSANDPDTILAKSSATIVPRKPSVLVYENNPLYGYLFNKEVGQIYPIKEEVTFSAFPFYFSGVTRSAVPLQYSWSSGAGNSGINPSITFRVPEDAEGSSNISIRISNRDKFTQGQTKNFLVQFNNQNDL